MDELEVFQSPRRHIVEWTAPANVRVVQTTRHGGCSRAPFGSLNLGLHVGDREEDVLRNRARLVRFFDLPAAPRYLNQVHGVEVADLDNLGTGHTPEADAAISFRAGTVAAILTADCLPILLTTHTGDRVAAAHGGWRGLTGGVIEATLAALDVDPVNVVAWIGPGIGRERFRVGQAVIDAASARHTGAAEFASADGADGYLFDLGAYAEYILKQAGVIAVSRCTRCTASDERFFSHRRDGETGRMATLIWRD